MTITGPVSLPLSTRVSSLKSSATLAVSAQVKAYQAQGIDVIGFGAGEPDFETPEHISAAAIAALREGRTHYEPVPGAMDARAAIARKLRDENGIDCSAEHVVITVGAKHALYLTMQCLLDPGAGQEVIVPTPAWVSYRPMIELAGGLVVEVPGAVENDFKITPEQLEAVLSPQTRAIIINSPSNPCGTMYAPDELQALADVLARHEHVVVIADEIYEKLIYGSTEHFSLGSAPALADRVVTINGLSKAFAMTGWRIGYLCAPGSDGVLARAATRLQSQMTSNITSFCYPAIIEALERGEAEVRRMRDVFATRGQLMHRLIGQWPQVRCPKPTGAFYVFPDMGRHLGGTTPQGRPLRTSLELAEALLEEAHVGVVPGEAFGASAASHVRLSFACTTEQIEEGCGRIERWLHAL